MFKHGVSHVPTIQTLFSLNVLAALEEIREWAANLTPECAEKVNMAFKLEVWMVYTWSKKRKENSISCLSRLESTSSIIHSGWLCCGTGGCSPSQLTFEWDAGKVRVRSPPHHTADVPDRDKQPQQLGLSPAINLAELSNHVSGLWEGDGKAEGSTPERCQPLHRKGKEPPIQ